MKILETAIVYVCILGVLVVVHEWGHFIVARIFKIRVDEFSMGFGPRMVKVGKRGDTEYNIRWIPLGGYVKIAGMEPDEEPLMNARDKAKDLFGKDKDDSLGALSKAPLTAENLPNVEETVEQKYADIVDGFYSKPLWQRSLVIFAGPFMSFVLGYFLLCSIGVVAGQPVATNGVYSVRPHSVAQQIGLRANDVIVAIDGVKIQNGNQMMKIIHSSPNKVLHLTVQRGSTTLMISGAPKVQPDSDTTEPIFGFTPADKLVRMSVVDSVGIGNSATADLMEHLESLVRHHNLNEFRQSAGGPIFIAETTYQAVTMGPPIVLELAGELSISLAIFNLFPIPILDGGHLLLFAVEGLRRGRRLTMEQQQTFMLAGLAIIGILFVFIMINDVHRAIPHLK